MLRNPVLLCAFAVGRCVRRAARLARPLLVALYDCHAVLAGCDARGRPLKAE